MVDNKKEKESNKNTKKAINNIQWDVCQDCDWFLNEDDEDYDKSDPDPIVYWCGYCNNINKGYCGLKIILKKCLEEINGT